MNSRLAVAVTLLNLSVAFAQELQAKDTKVVPERRVHFKTPPPDLRKDDGKAAVVVPTYDSQTSVREVHPLSADTLNAKMARNPSSLLNGKGQAIIDAAKRYNIDPLFFASVVLFETGNGLSKKYQKTKNPIGVTIKETDPATGKQSEVKEFKSVEEGLDAGAKFLSELVEGNKKFNVKNPESVAGMATAYSALGFSGAESSDEMTKMWRSTVVQFMNNLGKEEALERGK